MDIKKQFQYRIALLGSSKVGKTSILNQLVSSTFGDEYKPTIENDVKHVTEYNNKTFVCLIIDTYGGDDFPAMRKITINKCNGFIVVFSFENMQTYEMAKQRVKEIKKIKTEKTLILLVGNRKENTNHKIYSAVYDFCDNMRDDVINCKFIKVSATDHDDVQNMFNLLLSMYPLEIVDAINKERHTKKKCAIKNDFSFCDDDGNISRSPSLFSLNEFSTDDDIEKVNYSPKLSGNFSINDI